MSAGGSSPQTLDLIAGWEGSAYDQRVLSDAILKNLNIPEGKYLLADAGFQNSHRLLTPYHRVRYHLREWAEVGGDRKIKRNYITYGIAKSDL